MRVRATQRGYYGNKVREPGDEFSLAEDDDFSPNWMVETEASKRARSEADAEAKAEDGDAKAEDESPKATKAKAEKHSKHK